MPKKYRRKPQVVQALKTYFGQPMTDIRDFLLGSSVFVSTMEHGSIFEERLKGVLDVTPGDYILRSYDGQVTSRKAIEFEKIYEEDEQESLENGLAHALFSLYGYPVEDALKALANKDIKAFLLASLETRATSVLKATAPVTPKPAIKVNFESLGTDVDKVIAKINEQLEESMKVNSPLR